MNKKIVCITGTVSTGGHNAPRHMLIKDGFLRLTWFTTGRPITDAEYSLISTGAFHMANADNKVLAYMKYGGDFVGIMTGEFERALSESQAGVLIVGPQEIVAQVAQKMPQAKIFALKSASMELSPHLADASRKGQLHRIDVDAMGSGGWEDVYNEIKTTLDLP